MSDLNKVTIRYIGKGVGTIPGVPARDMNNDEARKYNITQLLKSGLYKIERPKRTYKKIEKKEEPAKEQAKDGE